MATLLETLKSVDGAREVFAQALPHQQSTKVNGLPPAVVLQREVETEATKFPEARDALLRYSPKSVEAYSGCFSMIDVAKVWRRHQREGKPRPLMAHEALMIDAGFTPNDTMQKFISHSYEYIALFPPFLDANLYKASIGLELLDRVAPTTVPVESGLIHRCRWSDSQDTLEGYIHEIFLESAQGVGEIHLTTADESVNTTAEGVALKIADKVRNNARLPLLGVYISQMGRVIAAKRFKDALYVGVNGDGNSNAASSVTGGFANWAAFELSDAGYAKCIDLYNLLHESLRITDAVAHKTLWGHMLQLTPFAWASGHYYDFAREGSPPRFFGGNLWRYNCTATGHGGQEDVLVAWDREQGGLVRYVEKELGVEYDRDPRTLSEDVIITWSEAYGKPNHDGFVVLNALTD
jgi:hypothetical protein